MACRASCRSTTSTPTTTGCWARSSWSRARSWPSAALLIVAVYLLQGLIAGANVASPHAISLLLILILLAPIQALDDVLTSLMSVFASPQSIFFRKYVLGPGLRLGVVLLLIVGGSGVGFLAVGYVAAGAFGIALYVVILWQVLGRRGMIARFRTSSMKIPAREILVFTIPLLTTDLVYVFLNTSDAIILEHFKGLDAVAAWRVVQPAAGLNTLVMSELHAALHAGRRAPARAQRSRRRPRAVLEHRDLDGRHVVSAVRPDLQPWPRR